MTPAELVLFALLHLVDPSAAERARLEAFAAEVTRAVDAAEALPFTGPAAREATIAALLVVANHESGIRAEVIDCRVRGDVGRSITAFQLMQGFARGGLSTRALCTSNELAAGQALRVLVHHSTRCTFSTRSLFRGYAAGDCSKASKAAGDMCDAWVRATTRLGVVGASCDTRRPLTWRPS